MSVQNNLASDALDQFDQPVGVSIIPAGQSWQDRQRIQYEAMKGLLYKDFHGLQDFYEQMQLYSATNNLVLGPAWRVIQPLAPRNRKVLETLTEIAGLGLVGQDLATLQNFQQSFVLPNEILENPDNLSSSLSL